MNLLAKKGVSEPCTNDLYMWATGLQTFQGWAWKMIDSGFKIPSNLAGLNLKWMGDMGECTAIHASAYNNYTRSMQEFDGKYCRLLIPVSGIPGAGFQMMVLGSCASSHCSNSDVKIIVDSPIEAVVPKTFTSRSIVSCVVEKELDSKAIAVICFLAILGAVVTIATLYDVITIQLKSDDSEPNSYKLQHNEAVNMNTIHTNGAYTVTEAENGPLPVKEDLGTSIQNGVILTSDFSITNKPKQEQSRIVKAVLAFSAYTNARKLLSTSQASGSLSAINGIRFLSMAWVILGHTYFFALNYTANGFDLGKTKINQYSFMAIIYATPSVDSFFALSGCLVAYLTLRELQKVGGAKKLNWFMFYFHRFWRLTPPYMLIILVGTILYRYIGNGALKPDGDNPFMENCRDNWWTNLLYINNFAKTDKMCMGWTWYLANDMQMYILSPLIFLPLFYNIIAGGVVSAIFMIGTIIATAVISHEHQYPVQSASPYAPTKQDGHYNDLMYIPFYTRMGPYIVGLITGFVLYKCKCKFRIPKVINLGCWVLCVLMTTAVIYGPYTKDDGHIMSTDDSTAYYTLFRTVWGIAVCWVIFACATGNGGWINDILSWSPYVPLGRLTYCAYLLHPLVMMMFYENRMQPVYFTDYDTVYYFLGNLVLSYGAAFVISLFFESPMMGLEKAIFKK
ncbi:nose resistant to fluoxetine protein 6-like [Mercenaria mercenaria]|uniref:nose resistant to fluoxetine protein 6-like n=1 Tax=Mercenaria mercenaria TaxID=6596 RepID=UPI00234E50EA|nr:nose resistant to fluoxetine protein 6-like [Mercenaria mercenaria]